MTLPLTIDDHRHRKFTNYAAQRKEALMAVRAEVARSGIGFGAALAIVISWSNNSSILWAIVHGVLSWLYVIYYAATR